MPISVPEVPPALLEETCRPPAPARGDRIVVAVSGGADSVALLHLLAALAPGRGWDLLVATLDHGLRGAAGAADRAFVEELARELGLPCRSDRRDARPVRGESPEQAARRVRLGFLAEVARETGARCVALGHTMDDQAETLLDRLGRGTGTRGLAGMRRWVPPLWRPLLGVRRAALRALLEREKLPFREDETNLDPAFRRNRVRNELLPVLERVLGPGAVPALARAARLAADDEDLLEALAAEREPGIVLVREEGIAVLDRKALGALPPALGRRILRRCLEGDPAGPVRPAASHLEALLRLARADGPGTRLDLPGGWTARREAGRLLLERAR